MKYKVLTGIVALMTLPVLIHAQGNVNGSFKKELKHGKNYSIIPKLPPAPKPEPFNVSTIPLPDSVVKVILVHYLPDGKHLIGEIELAGSNRQEIATIREDGSEFKIDG